MTAGVSSHIKGLFSIRVNILYMVIVSTFYLSYCCEVVTIIESCSKLHVLCLFWINFYFICGHSLHLFLVIVLLCVGVNIGLVLKAFVLISNRFDMRVSPSTPLGHNY